MRAVGCILVLLHEQGAAGESLHDGGDPGPASQRQSPGEEAPGSATCHRGVALHEVLAGQSSPHHQGKGAWLGWGI